MNLYDLSAYLRALAEHDDFEDAPVSYAENFLIRTFTYCVMNGCFPCVYLLAISDVSHAIVKFALNELDFEELTKATFLAEKAIHDAEIEQETEEPLEGPDDVIFDDNGEVPF